MSYGIKAYKSVGIKDDLAVADPHRVIQAINARLTGKHGKSQRCHGA